MRKILITFICALIILVSAFVPAMADAEFKITSGTILNGEQNADVSALITYEFSLDIKEVEADAITCLPASVSEIEIDGKILKVRLAFPKEYNTEYVLDLSALSSVDDKTLAEGEKKIKFKTKEGIAGKILEDDFETKTVDGSKWRAPASGSGAVQKDGDGGNWSYHIVSGGSVDNYTYPLPYPFAIEHKAVLDFDVIIENVSADYNFFTILGDNGLTGDEVKNFESYWTGLLKYDFEEKTFGVLYNQELYAGAAGYPKNANAAVSAKEGWNNLRVIVDLDKATLQLEVNGTKAVDENGNFEFEIPFSSKIGSAGCRLLNVRISNAGTADLYYDNFSYRQLYAPVITNSSVSEGEVLNETCPEIRMSFKNEITSLSLKLNGADVPESFIVKNADGTFSAFPSLMWGEDYVLEGTMHGIYGMEGTFTLNFFTANQEGTLIESAGFFKGGERIFALPSGDVTAKLKFWQEESETYAYLAAVYKKDGDRIEMVSPVSFGEFTSDGTLVEKDVTVTVPADTENCFIRVFVLTDTLTRIPYADSVLNGSMVLE